jgi:hypothetical protein
VSFILLSIEAVIENYYYSKNRITRRRKLKEVGIRFLVYFPLVKAILKQSF